MSHDQANKPVGTGDKYMQRQYYRSLMEEEELTHSSPTNVHAGQELTHYSPNNSLTRILTQTTLQLGLAMAILWVLLSKLPSLSQ